MIKFVPKRQNKIPEKSSKVDFKFKLIFSRKYTHVIDWRTQKENKLSFPIYSSIVCEKVLKLI